MLFWSEVVEWRKIVIYMTTCTLDSYIVLRTTYFSLFCYFSILPHFYASLQQWNTRINILLSVLLSFWSLVFREEIFIRTQTFKSDIWKLRFFGLEGKYHLLKIEFFSNDWMTVYFREGDGFLHLDRFCSDSIEP